MSVLAAGAVLAKPQLSRADTPESIKALKPMLDGVVPITDEERKSRIEHARKLMIDNKIDAVYLEPGSSLYYFTGLHWGNSERMFALVLPARGEARVGLSGF